MKNTLNNKIYNGYVSHFRFKPKIHKFKYNVFKIFINLENIEKTAKSLMFFSLNKFNLFSFHYKDYLGKTKNNPYFKAKELFIKHNLFFRKDKIYILCYPRMLGYVFNPITTYFCITKENKIRSVLYEVHNTFGDKHYYLTKYSPNKKDKTKKEFHVSPFFDTNGEYEFNSFINDKYTKIEINYYTIKKNKKSNLLNAIFYGKEKTFNDTNLLIYFLKFPFMTFKVIYAIHLNAIKLWIKGIKFFSRPNPPRNILSLSKTLKENNRYVNKQIK